MTKPANRTWRTNIALRLTPEMGAWLERRSSEDNRSLGNFVETLLIKHREQRDSGDAVTTLELLEAIEILIARADDLQAAIEGVTDQFEDEVSAISEAASAAEKVAIAARGHS